MSYMKSPKINYPALSAVLVALICLPSIAFGQIENSTELTRAVLATQPTHNLTASTMAGLRMPFIENVGQIDASVGFYAQTFAGTTYVTRAGELVYSLPAKNGNPGWTLVERFEQGKSKPVGKDANISQVSYINNQDGKALSQNAATFGKLDLGEVFTGIKVELVAHGDNVEKVYTVAPGAHADAIRMTLAGTNGLSKEAGGALLAQTGNGPVRFSAPIAWQEKGGAKTPVDVSYAIDNNGYGFELGDYDHSQPVIIDPLLQATYFGGSGKEYAYAINVHPITGDVYVLGESEHPGAGFPNTLPGTAGGLIANQTSGSNQFIARLSADLKTLIQTTYISYNNYFIPRPKQFLLHPVNGDLYLLVRGHETGSQQNPLKISSGAITKMPLGGFAYGYLMRFSSDLTTLKQSTYLARLGFLPNLATVNPINGDIYVVGEGDYYDDSVGVGRQAWIIRVSADLSSYISEKRFGSTKKDYSYGVAVHPLTGDVYVSGETEFNDFPATNGGYQANNNSLPSIGMKADGFIAQLSPDLAIIKQATYLGGTLRDWVDDIAFDKSGNNLMLAGATCSSDFPGLAGGAYSNPPTGSSSCSKYFAKMPSDLQNLTQSSMVKYRDIDIRMFVHPITDEVYGIGDGSLDNKTGYPLALRFKPDLTFSYGGLPLSDLRKHPGVAYAMSPLTGDVYIVGNQNSTTEVFPQTTGGFQATPASTAGGNADIYIARYTSDDIGSYVPKADLELTLNANPGSVKVGSQLTYTLTVKNNGPDEAKTVKITDVLPANAIFASTSSACSYSGTTVTCDAGTLASGGSKSFTLVITPTVAGAFSNTATVSGQVTDPSPGNNSATKSVAVLAAPGGSLPPPSVGEHALSTANIGVGSQVTITGQGFTNKKGSVKIGIKTAVIVSWTDSSIVIKLPTIKAGTYPVKVINKNKTSVETEQLTLHAPEISAMSVSGGAAKTKVPVTINGQYFGTGVKPVVYLVSSKNNRIKATVLNGYADAQLTITTPKLKAGNYAVLIVNSAGNSGQSSSFIVQ